MVVLCLTTWSSAEIASAGIQNTMAKYAKGERRPLTPEEIYTGIEAKHREF